MVLTCKIQYIKLHQADQRGTECSFNIVFGHHSSKPSAIIYSKAFRAAEVMSKILFPDEFFRATLNTGAFKMRNDYIGLVLKESHPEMGHFDGQGRAGRDFQSGLKPFRHQMFYSRGLSEAFPDRHENTGHSPCSWVTRMGSAVSGRRELERKSQSLRVSTCGSGWKGPRYQSS